MHSFKKILLRVFLIAAVLYFFDGAVRYFYQPIGEVSYYMNGELDRSKGKIDTLFCGTSTIYRGLSPQIWDKEMGGVSFNIASSAQALEDTYVFMKQEAERNPVKRIFLGISPRAIMQEKTSGLSKKRVYDSLTGPVSKLNYLIRHTDPDKWLYMAYYPVRVDRYFDFKQIKKNIAYKRTEDYRNFVYPKSVYKGKGYFASKRSYRGKSYQHLEKSEGLWRENKVNKEEEKYLCKIMEYCKQNDIELYLLWIPVSGKEAKKLGDIEGIHDYFSTIAENYDVPFWNFMHYKNVVSEFTNDKCWDSRHLNSVGGEKFSHLLINVYQSYQEGKDLGEYFTDSCPYY